jgi:hypothetical protein
MLKASFITKVYEEGGDFSTDVIWRPILRTYLCGDCHLSLTNTEC